MPPRVLNKRTHGIPPGAVYIGRPSKWGNPWSHLPRSRARYLVKTVAEAVLAYRLWFLTDDGPEATALRAAARQELRGHDLVCYGCKPCHGDVLLEYANAPNADGCRACPWDGPCTHLAAMKAVNEMEA